MNIPRKTQPLKRYYVWEHESGNSVTCQPTPLLMKDGKPFDDVNELLYIIEAATWEEAMSIHHLRMGWEPYDPGGKAQKCPNCGAFFYPEGSGLCWSCGNKV